MTEFTEVVRGWETFYLLVGTAAVTLIGLLFVAVSLNIEAFRRNLEADIQLFGVLTFNSFFYVLILAIVFVIPGQTPINLGVLLFALGIIGFLNTANQFRRSRKVHPAGKMSFITWRFIGPMLCLLLLAAIAVGIMLGYTGLMYGLVAVAVYLLGSAAQNAWVLLMRRAPEPKPAAQHRK